MCEFNTKITISQLLIEVDHVIVSEKSKTYTQRQGYLSPGNSIVLEIAAALSQILADIFFLILFKLKHAFQDLCMRCGSIRHHGHSYTP